VSGDNLGLELKKYVVGLKTKVPLENGRQVVPINLDNAATTPPFISVMREINKFAPWYSSIHRGLGFKSQVSSDIYEESRREVLEFVQADPDYYTVIYVRNTTEGINKLSYRLAKNLKGCKILTTGMEHHSNDLPWRDKYCVLYVNVGRDGRISLTDLERKLKRYKGKVKLVAITGASNVTGYINPIHEAAEIAHKYHAKILVDGAQLVPHCPVEMKEVHTPENIDFLVFSAHKMYAPFGIGVIIAPKKYLRKGGPEYPGGGTVKIVTRNRVIWDDVPHRDEAGTPNLIGVVALKAAIKTLKCIGMEEIFSYEKKLADYALSRLSRIPEIKIYGDKTPGEDRLGIIPFNIEGLSHDIVAKVLSHEGGIAVRNGCFCAQPYIQRLMGLSSKDIRRHIKNPDLPRPGMVRVSFGLYNTFSEIDELESMLRYIVENREIILEKYEGKTGKSP
jgi:cysteine desulfurase/selenocysteine lyase